MRLNGSDKTGKGLVGHDDTVAFGKLHTDSSILQQLCKLMATKTDIIFVALSCLFPSDQLREWYGSAVALLDDIFLEVLTVQFPSLYCGGTHFLYSSPSFSIKCWLVTSKLAFMLSQIFFGV